MSHPATRKTSNKGKVTEITRTLKGFPLEVHFAMHRVLKHHGVEIREIQQESLFGPPGTQSISLSKRGEVHTCVFNVYSLGTNPWGITHVDTKDSRLHSIYKFETTDTWAIDSLEKEIQLEMEKDPVLRGSSFSIGRGSLEFFEPQIEKPIFSESLEDCVNYSIYAPIQFHTELPTFRRGVLLSGTYGTGKSSVAAYTANLATAQGITFIYMKDPHLFEKGIQYFSALGKCIVFVEDIDRLFEKNRNANIDKMLNTLDGVDSKSEDTMFIFTTNNVQIIERALLRPGRIDSIVEMELPNTKATHSILSRYASKYASQETITEVTNYLGAHQFPPAVLREMVNRAVFGARSRGVSELTAQDITKAAESLRSQVQLINSSKPERESSLGKAFLNILDTHMRRNSMFISEESNDGED